MSTLGFSDTAPNGPYGIPPEQLIHHNINRINSNVNVVMSAETSVASTTLAYSSYIFTTGDIVLFSYEDGTQLEVYDSSGNSVPLTPDVLDRGEHTYVSTSLGIYLVAGSNKFAVLAGDATTKGVSGYYAMNADGCGASKELYTYVPTLHGTSGHSLFIVFAYQDNTAVTIQQEVSSGVYMNIAAVTLDRGEHWANSSIFNKYLHITANKPVSALTCHDQS
jgi:hypothetical protein